MIKTTNDELQALRMGTKKKKTQSAAALEAMELEQEHARVYAQVDCHSLQDYFAHQQLPPPP